MKLSILIFVCLFPALLMARVQLKVSMTHKLGIDNNLVLKSELHSIEEFYGKEFVTLKMRNGFQLKLQAYFSEQKMENQLGPSDFVQIKAILLNPGGDIIKEFKDDDTLVQLWKSKKFVYTSEIGQQIEIIIIPEPT